MVSKIVLHVLGKRTSDSFMQDLIGWNRLICLIDNTFNMPQFIQCPSYPLEWNLCILFSKAQHKQNVISIIHPKAASQWFNLLFNAFNVIKFILVCNVRFEKSDISLYMMQMNCMLTELNIFCVRVHWHIRFAKLNLISTNFSIMEDEGISLLSHTKWLSFCC